MLRSNAHLSLGWFPRRVVWCAVLALLTSGCPKRGPHPSALAGSPSPTAEEMTVTVGTPPAAITLVNSQYGFVVIDFLNRPMPGPGRRLEVYRDGKRIGAVRVTEPMRARFASADIVEGEPRAGDLVR